MYLYTHARDVSAKARSLSDGVWPSDSRDISSRVVENLETECSGGLHRRNTSCRRNALFCVSSHRATLAMRTSSCSTTKDRALLAYSCCLCGKSICTIGIAFIQYLHYGYTARNSRDTTCPCCALECLFLNEICSNCESSAQLMLSEIISRRCGSLRVPSLSRWRNYGFAHAQSDASSYFIVPGAWLRTAFLCALVRDVVFGCK